MEGYIEVPGGRLFTKVEGDGPPIVLIHAAIVDLNSWDPVVPGLIAAGYRVIRYDMRGFGRSTALDEEFSDRDDLRAVLDAFGVRRAAAIGNSRGGCVAIDVAIETPDRIVAIVGLGTEPRGFEGTVTPLERDLVDEEERLASASPRDPDAIADFMVRTWCDGPGQPADRLPAGIREAVRAAARPLYVPGHVTGRLRRLDPPANVPGPGRGRGARHHDYCGGRPSPGRRRAQRASGRLAGRGASDRPRATRSTGRPGDRLPGSLAALDLGVATVSGRRGDRSPHRAAANGPGRGRGFTSPAASPPATRNPRAGPDSHAREPARTAAPHSRA
jgi:3-oxoadipate enol-lactonase